MCELYPNTTKNINQIKSRESRECFYQKTLFHEPKCIYRENQSSLPTP